MVSISHNKSHHLIKLTFQLSLKTTTLASIKTPERRSQRKSTLIPIKPVSNIVIYYCRYILDANGGIVTFFNILISVIVVPNVLLTLYVIAFGTETDSTLYYVLIYSEIFFLLEIIQNFFTSFSDPEHYDMVDSLKLIA